MPLKTTPPRERSPLGEMLAIALPVAATMVSYTVAQFVDAKMVSRLPDSATAVAALVNGGIIAFVPLSLMMGLTTVVNTYASQHIGAGRPRVAAEYPWNSAWVGTILWALIVMPVALALPTLLPWIASAFGDTAPIEAEQTASVLRLEAEYAQIFLYGAVFTIVSRSMNSFFFALHRGSVVLVATIVGNLVNFVCNWLFIYGKFGFPRMGVPGSAVATCVGQAVELAIPMAVFLGPKLNSEYGTRAAWRPKVRRMREIVSLGWAASLMFGNEIACWAIFLTALVGGVSVADNAAGGIAFRYMQVSFMPAVGISIAVTALVGRSIGMGRPDIAAKRAWLGMWVTMVYMGACAAAFVLFRGPLVRFLMNEADPLEADVLRIGGRVMILAALFQLFDAIGITMVGALRGAGDTRWPGVVTVVLSWACIIGLGWALLSAFPEWGSIGPWVGAAVYIIVFALVMLRRFAAGRWREIRLVERAEPAVSAKAV